ncbi:hypothetical protein XENORESO_003160, partial [Xenotaenia resolanae]
GSKVRTETRDQRVKLVKKDKRVSQALDIEGQRAKLVLQVKRVSQVSQDLQVHRASRVFMEMQEYKDPQDSRVLQGTQESQAE